jgi:hypothetical protein
LTPILIEGKKIIGKIDTGSDTTCISKICLNNKLNIDKVNSVNGSLNFLSSDNNCKRIGQTDPLTLTYMNNISFKHSFEVVKFNETTTQEFDVLLGTDVLGKINIGLTGVAYMSCLVINSVFIYYFIIHLSPAYVRLYN